MKGSSIFLTTRRGSSIRSFSVWRAGIGNGDLLFSWTRDVAFFSFSPRIPFSVLPIRCATLDGKNVHKSDTQVANESLSRWKSRVVVRVSPVVSRLPAAFQAAPGYGDSLYTGEKRGNPLGVCAVILLYKKRAFVAPAGEI